MPQWRRSVAVVVLIALQIVWPCALPGRAAVPAMAAGPALPSKGNVFISLADRQKPKSIEIARGFAELGFTLYATSGTAAALKAAGIPVKKLFNTSGQSYRDGGFGERLPKMSEGEALSALSRDGKLVKRPLVLGRDYALVGFDEAAYKARFR